MTAAINIQGLVKAYPGGDGVRGLDLSIPEGCSFGLLGPNGAGKSTTIKLLMGLIAPDAGQATVLGHDIRTDALAIRRCTGYVPEHHHIYPWMRVGEVLRFTRAFYPSWDVALCDELIAQYALDPVKKVKALSNGMVTKLALVLALSHKPRLLLLDEPTTGLDPLIREEFLDGVTDLLQHLSCTVLFSSHIMSDVERIADTIGIVHAGELLLCAEREALLANTKRVYVTLAGAPQAPAAAPPGTVWESRQNGDWRLTVHGFSADTLERIRQTNNVDRCEVRDIGLEEIFKDVIKGARAR
jgi:ABC-2 type transport system ATP-binding protein